MKYQLLLLTIYLITVYSQNACTYTTQHTCDEDNNCEWEETKAGSCGQTTTKDCSGLSEDNCNGGCTFTSTAGTCANVKIVQQCTVAQSLCAETAGCTLDAENTCIPKIGEICKGATQQACEEETQNACEWIAGTCSNSCTGLEQSPCGIALGCKWTEATGTCKIIEKGGSGSGSGSDFDSGSGKILMKSLKNLN